MKGNLATFIFCLKFTKGTTFKMHVSQHTLMTLKYGVLPIDNLDQLYWSKLANCKDLAIKF